VPTTRPRHQVTETDELAAALDKAERRWPGLSRGQLIARLALEGDREHEDDVNRRLAAIERFAGACTGAYEPGYLEAVRQGWPD